MTNERDDFGQPSSETEYPYGSGRNRFNVRSIDTTGIGPTHGLGADAWRRWNDRQFPNPHVLYTATDPENKSLRERVRDLHDPIGLFDHLNDG